MTEDQTEETERTPKTISNMSDSARAVLASLSDSGYTRDETIAILAIANALLNGELFMAMLLEHATLVNVPIHKPAKQTPSMN